MDERIGRRELLTVPEVAALLAVSDDSIRLWCRSGVLPGLVKVGRAYRVKRQVLERWLATDDAPPAPVARPVPVVRLVPSARRVAR